MIESAILIAAAVCAATLLIIDLRSRRLPDPLNLLLGLLGLGFHYTHTFDLVPLTALLAGATLGALLLYALRAVYLRRRGIEALGLRNRGQTTIICVIGDRPRLSVDVMQAVC